MLGVWERRRSPWRRIGGARGGGLVASPVFWGEISEVSWLMAERSALQMSV